MYRRNSIRTIVVGLTTMMFLVRSIGAVESDVADSVRPKEAVVVTAMRARPSDAVAQTTIDSAALGRTMMGQDVQYVLESLAPSILSYSESGTNFSNYGSFRMRGMDQTRINVTLNGVPLNDMIDQGVFFSNITDLANGMQSMQVQRGVGMSRNGTASYAGAVDLATPSLSGSTPSGRLQFTTGSFGLLRGSAEAFTGVQNNVALFAKATAFTTDGYRYHTGTDSWSALVSAAWFGDHDVVKLTAVGGNTKNGLGYIAVPKPLADQDPRTNVNDTTDHDDFGQHLVQLQWDHAFDRNTLSVVAYFGGAGGDYFSGFRDSANMLTQINYPLKNDHVGVLMQSSWNLEPGTWNQEPGPWNLELGLHAYRFWRRNWESVSPESYAPYYDDRTVKDEVSGFARLRLDEGQFHAYADIQARNVGMTFQPDERWVPEGTSIPGHHWFFLNPRVGFSLDMDDATMLFGSVGRTGREPTRFDLLGGTQINEANLDVVLDPHTIRAEYATDVEVGIRHRHQHGMISLNGFAMFFNDEIAPIGRYIDQQFVQLRKNVESSTRLGLEFEARQRLFIDELSLAMNATVMKANIASYDPDNLGTDTTYTNVNPVLTPAWQGTATLTYAPLTSLSFDLSLRFVGEQFLELTNDPSLVLPAFTVLNAAARWTFLDRHRIVLNVANLTDLVYATNGATSFYNNAAVPTLFIQAPRSFTLLLELSI